MQGLLAGLRLQSGVWNFGVFEDLDVVVEVLDHVAYGNIFGASRRYSITCLVIQSGNF